MASDPLPTENRYSENRYTENRYIVPALAQGLGILSLFGSDHRSFTAPEIAKKLALPRTKVFRLLQTLQSMDYLRCEPDKRRFSLGPAMAAPTFASRRVGDSPMFRLPASELADCPLATTHACWNCVATSNSEAFLPTGDAIAVKRLRFHRLFLIQLISMNAEPVFRG